MFAKCSLSARYLTVISCLWPLLSVPSRCLRKSICLISCCLILSHLLSHLVLVAVCYKKNSPCFVASFLPLGLLTCSLLSADQVYFTSSTIRTCIIGKHRFCSLIVWPGRWVSHPVISNSKQFFSLPKGSIEYWIPIKCQRVDEQEVGAKGPGPALVDSSMRLREFMGLAPKSVYLGAGSPKSPDHGDYPSPALPSVLSPLPPLTNIQINVWCNCCVNLSYN